MMVKITEKCTMGCTHCMNAATPDGKHMSLSTFEESLCFLANNELCEQILLITGGEPTEHPEFFKLLDIMFEMQKDFPFLIAVAVTTNGEALQNDHEPYLKSIKVAKEAGIDLFYQVSADVRYYPRRIQTHKRIFREPNIVLCDDCIRWIYPQGRAKENNLDWKANSSKCFNVRAIAHQLPENARLRDIEQLLLQHEKSCTPHIGVNGEIKLGESDLCPACATIYDDMDTIMSKIRNFKCDACDFINNRLPEQYRRLL